MRNKFHPALALFVALCQPAVANNIQVSNVSISDQDSVTKTANIVFDLAWENSWRLSTGPANWDAAWVFVKFHNGDNAWRHSKLAPVDGQHVVPAGAALKVGVTNGIGMGVFVYRNAPGAGNVSWTGIKLKWNYGADNILDSAIITADVQAIEMVYVPEGAFYLGDGTSGSHCRGDILGAPYQVTSAQEIPVGNTIGEMYFNGRYSGAPGGVGSASTSIYPAEFPNGYAAFYCMKYETSQGQYARYLNTGGPGTFYQAAGAGSRQVATGSPPNVVSSTPDRAYCFEIHSGTPSNVPSAQYASWAGLRPMSEFEYEKACRGPIYPVAHESAWGTAVLASLPYTLASDGSATEAVSVNYNENAGNVWTLTTRGSLGQGGCRVGMFAKSSYNGTTSPRIQAGATYWGILDMTGGVSEPIALSSRATLFGTTAPADPQNYVMVGGTYYSYSSNAFRGSHGNGTSTYPTDWGSMATHTSSRLGGDGFSSGSAVFRVSSYSPVENPNPGIRCVRTAP